MNRIVTGHDKDGNAVFVKTGETEHVVKLPGKTFYELWYTDPDTKIPVPMPKEWVEPTKACTNVFPPIGGTRCRIIEWTGEKTAEGSDMNAVYAKELPGFLDKMENGAMNNGFHQTDSVDYGVCLAGEIELELDNNEKVLLKPGDLVVQNGTRHAWHPKKFPCRMLWVLVGYPSEL